ncbi:MAG: hypothetical protein M3511_14525, partial [Deinococcota bacterium]|nr:hypothetical protein [Deinococcota bacterium]
MKSLRFLAVSLLVLGLGVGSSQTTVPADPLADPLTTDLQEMAMIRIAHFSSNAQTVAINLLREDDETAFSAEELADLEYR